MYVFKCFSSVPVDKVCVYMYMCMRACLYMCVHACIGYSWSLSILGAVIYYFRLVDIKKRNLFLTILENLGSRCWVGVPRQGILFFTVVLFYLHDMKG